MPEPDPWEAREDVAVPDEIPIASACPACAENSLSLLTVQSEVAHFGRTLETLLKCGTCGFRHTDFMVLDQRAPVRLRLRATREDHLWSRVIRSNSGTWTIEELGFRAEPTSSSEAFVTNVEGLLDRAADVITTARNFQDDPDKRALCEALLERCGAMQEGREPVTVMIEDPFGNSAIVHEDVVKEEMTPEEVAGLATGMIVFDKDELKDTLG